MFELAAIYIKLSNKGHKINNNFLNTVELAKMAVDVRFEGWPICSGVVESLTDFCSPQAFEEEITVVEVLTALELDNTGRVGLVAMSLLFGRFSSFSLS